MGVKEAYGIYVTCYSAKYKYVSTQILKQRNLNQKTKTKLKKSDIIFLNKLEFIM